MSGHAGDTHHYHLFGDERYGHRHPFLHINHDHDGRDDVTDTLVAVGMDALPPPWRRELTRTDVETVVRAIAPLIRSDALGRPTIAQLEWHVAHLASLQRRFAEVCVRAAEQDVRIRELEDDKALWSASDPVDSVGA